MRPFRTGLLIGAGVAFVPIVATAAFSVMGLTTAAACFAGMNALGGKTTVVYHD